MANKASWLVLWHACLFRTCRSYFIFQPANEVVVLTFMGLVNSEGSWETEHMQILTVLTAYTSIENIEVEKSSDQTLHI